MVRFEWTADVNSKVFSLIGSKFGQFYSKSIQVQPSNLFIKLFKQHISARNSLYQGYIDIIQRWEWSGGCGIKLKDRFPSKELRETRYRWHGIGITAEQAALVWACAAKRRRWLGEEMYGVWSRRSKTKRKTKEDLEKSCQTGLSSTEHRGCYGS